MKKENKSTEPENTDKKLHISDVMETFGLPTNLMSKIYDR